MDFKRFTLSYFIIILPSDTVSRTQSLGGSEPWSELWSLAILVLLLLLGRLGARITVSRTREWSGSELRGGYLKVLYAGPSLRIFEEFFIQVFCNCLVGPRLGLQFGRLGNCRVRS